MDLTADPPEGMIGAMVQDWQTYCGQVPMSGPMPSVRGMAGQSYYPPGGAPQPGGFPGMGPVPGAGYPGGQGMMPQAGTGQ